jgi:hypothetical protein
MRVTESAPPSRWVDPGAPALPGDVACSAVMIGMPCYGGALTTAALHGLLATQRALLAQGIGFYCATTTNESLVQRARNTIVAHFLASACSHLVFIDADIGFGAETVLRLIAQDRPVIGALCRLKRLDRVEWAVEWQPDATGRIRRDATTGALQAASIGTGMLCLRRDALLRMAEAYPGLRYAPEGEETPAPAWHRHCQALFEAGIDPATGRYLGEDYMFCARWRAIGGEIWCDPALLLEHHGQACFAGNPMDLVRPA